MSPDITVNLMPEERQRAYRRRYFFRLAAVTAALASFLLVLHAALLIPAYALERSQKDARASRLAALESNQNSADQTALQTRLSALTTNTNVLAALPKYQTAGEVMRAVLAVSRPGIQLTSFSFTPKGTSGTLQVSGIADTRDHLRSFQLALEAAPFASRADLPVSAYAQDAAINFSVTITLESQL